MTRSFLLYFLIIIFLSCESTTPEDNVISLKETSVAAAEDEVKISDYLKTHFYNYEDFQNPKQGFDYKVKIDTLSGNNIGKTPMSDQAKTKSVTIDGVIHKTYYIIVKEGAGDNARFTDSLLVRYQGETVNRTVFDSSDYPIWFDSLSNVRGWRELIPMLKKGVSKPLENEDGTPNFPRDYGIGIIIFPSRLGYFSRSIGGLSYAPLVFSIDLLRTHPSDIDKDSVDSFDEDINQNGDVLDDDTDSDLIPDYLDDDDDGDGILTKDEYDEDKDGKADDYDKDGIPDYLDNKSN